MIDQSINQSIIYIQNILIVKSINVITILSDSYIIKHYNRYINIYIYIYILKNRKKNIFFVKYRHITEMYLVKKSAAEAKIITFYKLNKINILCVIRLHARIYF